MKTVLQRVKYASVEIEHQIVAKIDSGILVLLGIKTGDTQKEADYLAHKIIHLRMFEDDQGKMNRSLIELNKEMLVISQFTLYGDSRKGRRPSFTDAMEPEKANQLYEYFVEVLRKNGASVKTGIFGAEMGVSLLNDGPVTFIIESI